MNAIEAVRETKINRFTINQSRKALKFLEYLCILAFFTCGGPYECEEGYDRFEEDTLEEHTEHHNKNGR